MATCLLTEFFFTFRFYIKIRVTILHIPPIFYPLKVCFDHSHKKNFDYDLIQSLNINYFDKIYVFYIISNYKKGLFHAKSMVLQNQWFFTLFMNERVNMVGLKNNYFGRYQGGSCCPANQLTVLYYGNIRF